MAIDPKVIEELKAKHGEVFLLASKSHEVVVRKPDRQIWRKFVTLAADQSRRPDAIERIFLDCVVYPDAAGVQALLDRYPALAQQFGAEVTDLARDGEVEKKVL